MDFVQSREETPFCIGGWDGICCGYLFNVYRGGEGRGGSDELENHFFSEMRFIQGVLALKVEGSVVR